MESTAADVGGGALLEHERVELGSTSSFERWGLAAAGAVERGAVDVADRDVAERADAHAVDLVVGAEVDRGAHTEVAEDRDVGVGEGVHGVAAVQATPAHRPAVVGGVATEITEVAGPFEGDAPDAHPL